MYLPQKCSTTKQVLPKSLQDATYKSTVFAHHFDALSLKMSPNNKNLRLNFHTFYMFSSSKLYFLLEKQTEAVNVE